MCTAKLRTMTPYDIMGDEILEKCPQLKTFLGMTYEKPKDTPTKKYFSKQWTIKDPTYTTKKLRELYEYLRHPLKE